MLFFAPQSPHRYSTPRAIGIMGAAAAADAPAAAADEGSALLAMFDSKMRSSQ